MFGYRPGRTAGLAAAVLVALGGWSVASTGWGGLPNQAWRFLDQSLIAAGALLLGCLLAAAGRRRLVLPAVLAGIVVNAGEILLRSLAQTVPAEWFYGRRFQGAIGYHSAQANLAAIGLALSVALLASRSAAGRALAGASAGLMVSTLLLTQSRAGIVAGVLCLVVTVALLRDLASLLRAAPVAVGAGLLVIPLKTLDRALVDQSGVAGALRSYALWSVAVMLGIALCAIPALRSERVRLVLVVALGIAALLGAVATLRVELRAGSTAHHLISTLRHIDTDPSLEAGPGSTRILSLSFNGRRDAWRVAWSMSRSHVVEGQGQGTFPVAWTKERRLLQLYILQPHSVLLELLGELGAIGLALFTLAIALIGVAVARAGSGRIATAAAAGGLVALVGQAALDWTWSFPALVAAAFLVAGAAAGGRRAAAPSGLATVAGSLALFAVLTSFAAPWLGHRLLGQARGAIQTSPSSSVHTLDSALRWNRWDPAAHELAGVAAERLGEDSVAAGDYAAAARLSQSPWLERLFEARAARAGGDAARAGRACALAHGGNPAETQLYGTICTGPPPARQTSG